MAKQTPFYDKHTSLNAKMIDFGGFNMPIQYKSIKQEHKTVREEVGIFDVSHMGEFVIEGEEALDFVQWVITNDAGKLKPGKALYTVMCNKQGGIIDDLLVYRLGTNRFMLVVNAANIEKDYHWIASQNNFKAELKNISASTCLLAVQGPNAQKALQPLTELSLREMGFYTFQTGKLAGYENVIISATGYTGEKGFELYFDKNQVRPGTIWDAIMEAGREFGLQPVGLGARDTLRLEKGFLLYGNDIDETTHPYQAKLNWLVKPNKGNFIGKEKLGIIENEGFDQILTGFKMESAKKIPRKGYSLCNASGKKIGHVTSGGLSITLQQGIGLGYVQRHYLNNNPYIWVKVRKELCKAVIEEPPFIKKEN